MLNKMKQDILAIKREPYGKKLRNDIIASICIWLYVFLVNFYKNNTSNFLKNFSLIIIVITFIYGCLTAVIANKNKNMLILFKTYSIFMMSFGSLFMAYTSYYTLLKEESILFYLSTIIIYILIFILRLRRIKSLVNSKESQQSASSKNGNILLVSSICFAVGCFILGPIINSTSQETMFIILLCCGLFLSYILIASVPYYLMEYIVSKEYK